MSNTQKTGFVYSSEILQYRFSNQHPFNQMRLKLTTELLSDLGYLKPEHIVKQQIATVDELNLIHSFDIIQYIRRASHRILNDKNDELNLIHSYYYIQSIRRASHGILNENEAKKYCLDGSDTLQFRMMHKHSARIVGGALNLADKIMDGTFTNGCHLGGGLHH